MINFRKSIRLPSYNYTLSGAYFITVCTQNREHSLGEILQHEMKLSRIGEIILKKWFDIPKHHKQVELDEFIVMPNHIHGIIWIVGARPGVTDILFDTDRVCQGKPQRKEIESREFGKPQSGSLSIIINQYKGAVKRWCNQNDFKYFRWQRNYYEHIVRSNEELVRISEYIKNNPQNWSEDEYR
jgi:REP element-mobilizing transposase RayT